MKRRIPFSVRFGVLCPVLARLEYLGEGRGSDG
jgi:hypothetical protein